MPVALGFAQSGCFGRGSSYLSPITPHMCHQEKVSLPQNLLDNCQQITITWHNPTGCSKYVFSITSFSVSRYPEQRFRRDLITYSQRRQVALNIFQPRTANLTLGSQHSLHLTRTESTVTISCPHSWMFSAVTSLPCLKSKAKSEVFTPGNTEFSTSGPWTSLPPNNPRDFQLKNTELYVISLQLHTPFLTL